MKYFLLVAGLLCSFPAVSAVYSYTCDDYWSLVVKTKTEVFATDDSEWSANYKLVSKSKDFLTFKFEKPKVAEDDDGLAPRKIELSHAVYDGAAQGDVNFIGGSEKQSIGVHSCKRKSKAK